METFYLIIVICLVILAVSDLVVGVSNDAVNFLNSALGSKAATRKTIMIVATAGILLGAISSSGMMEIARKGIFVPEMFTFADIMVIFLAVMVTDIILLDLFNTFGMPTSTTVSIMFELLGAAFTVAVLKILMANDSFSTLGDYLNTDNAVLIISGIFLSVLIAFSIGMMVQYFVRMIFTFDLEKTLKKYGAVFGGVAITTITYFLLIKGFKKSSFIPEDVGVWIQENTILLIGLIFVFWTIICFILMRALKVNVLKIVVLSGTFSLAMAFAGNDLVNFIGVPIAGLQSFELWQTSGMAPDEMGMAVLGGEARANFWLLVFAGLIMVITLWFSKKARSVTETEINLARESVGTERFKSNLLARAIVRGGIRLGKVTSSVMSEKMKDRIDSKFEKKLVTAKAVKDQPAFDMVRASVNLMVASILIAFATSLKLPLSTTYVSFMVAMGTSLADRAWNRDSAVYRVAGVVNVITGWLFTALIAFSSAGILALVIFYGEIYAVIGLMLLVGFLIIRSSLVHKKLESKKDNALSRLMQREKIESSEVFEESKNRIAETLKQVSDLIQDTYKGLETEDRKLLAKAGRELDVFRKEHADLSASFFFYIKKIESEGHEEGQFYLHGLNHLQNIAQSVDLITQKVFDHVRNMHQSVQQEKLNELDQLTDQLSSICEQMAYAMLNGEKAELDHLQKEVELTIQTIDGLEVKQINRIRSDQSSAKNSLLYLSILSESRDVIDNFVDLLKLYQRHQD